MDDKAEFLLFPTIYAGQKRRLITKISYSKIEKSELM